MHIFIPRVIPTLIFQARREPLLLVESGGVTCKEWNHLLLMNQHQNYKDNFSEKRGLVRIKHDACIEVNVVIVTFLSSGKEEHSHLSTSWFLLYPKVKNDAD